MDSRRLSVAIDDARQADVAVLLVGHLEGMKASTPVEGVFALELDAFSHSSITLWTARETGILMGCGALKELSPTKGEVKAMRTAPEHLRKGVARNILQVIVDESRRRGYQWLNLETGSGDAFAAARGLYNKHGFAPCGPFGDYTENGTSAFFELVL